ncbi:hypothetical protein TRIATDRAFT_83986 [Trichoderma atroviride IMI 206040]|uniref:Uncharacterized protein n=1 Tax=Hypocrea atroviridis (strain ATCC 20476 / IMI 206040) TaxID=452589 RepID=G9P6F9_HYPAI|nr:uncharacterized protein TRIATDRAFT_83986 [Trichoderma atroviride IMI 206040]EHK42274.1 hypothetical protein TRIATDRAFT_83986 [Trichoderma atroviride IMI 206040]
MITASASYYSCDSHYRPIERLISQAKRLCLPPQASNGENSLRALSQDAALIATASYDKTVSIWNCLNLERISRPVLWGLDGVERAMVIKTFDASSFRHSRLGFELCNQAV